MLIEETADQLYHSVLRQVMSFGQITKPRGFTCKELSPFNLRLINPQANIVSNEHRKINLGFAAAELYWILNGRDDVATLEPFNSKIKNFSDNGTTFFGAYGPKYVGQMPYILQTLKGDPWTRQAVLTIWRESPPKTKDVPCTVMLHFIRRPIDTLNLIVYMRSQDCWLGLPYDLHNFTCMQILTAYALDLKLGMFDLVQGSLHAYDTDFPKIEKLISEPVPDKVELTPLAMQDLFGQKLGWMRDYEARKLQLRP